MSICKQFVLLSFLAVVAMSQSGCFETLDPKKEALEAGKKYAAGRLGLSGDGDALDGYQKESTYTDSTGATVVPPITEHEVLRKNTTVDLGRTTSTAETIEDDVAGQLP